MQKLTVESKDTFYLQLEEEVFLSFHTEEGKSIAFVFNHFVGKDKVNEVVDEALAYLNIEKENIVSKCVGPISLCEEFEKVLKEMSFKELKCVSRSGRFEIVYRPEKGQIRLTKELSPENKEIVKNIRESAPVLKPSGDIKVLVVDDSKTIRNLLTRIFDKEEGITVVATAEKPSEVEALIQEHKPDVITLDIHMPEMTGVDLLRSIGPKYEIPTIMVTSISMEEGPLVLEALELGAFDYIQKPSMSEVAEVAPLLIEKVKEASTFKATASAKTSSVVRKAEKCDTDAMVVIGSSTGGTNALKDILTSMPAEIPPVLIVQHIPAVFSKAFADRLDGLCPFTVKEAEEGDMVEKNTVYIAPGGKQMKVKQKGSKLHIQITDDAPVNRFRPSVDYLFDSIVPLTSQTHIVSVILTGMGKDGANGMLRLKEAGAKTIAQDEESCVVFGMPKEAIRLNAAMAIEHKDHIAAKISEFTIKTKQTPKPQAS